MDNLVKSLKQSHKLFSTKVETTKSLAINYTLNFLSVSSLIPDTNVKKKLLKNIKSIKNDINIKKSLLNSNKSIKNDTKQSKTLLVEGKDKNFFDSVQSNLIKHEIINRFDLNIVQSLKGKSNMISHLKQLNANESAKTYGIVDDDGDLSNGDIIHLKNLFYLKRHSKENYTMDPIHIYFYLKTNKIDKTHEFVSSIEKRIEQALSTYYSSLNLDQIMKMIYSKDSKDTKSLIKLLQLIIDEFEDKIKQLLIDDTLLRILGKMDKSETIKQSIFSLFFVKKNVYLNKNILLYSNLFLNLHGHTLESFLYPKLLNGYKIDQKNLIDSFLKNAMIIPDELVDIFKLLNYNLIQLNEQNFHEHVLKSKEHYFIKISDLHENTIFHPEDNLNHLNT